MTTWRRQIQRVVNDPSAPVLECLVPRVFRPWPQRDERRYLSTLPARDTERGQQPFIAAQSRAYGTPGQEDGLRRKRDPVLRWVDSASKPMYKIRNHTFTPQTDQKKAQRLRQDHRRPIEAQVDRSGTDSAWYQAIVEAGDAGQDVDAAVETRESSGVLADASRLPNDYKTAERQQGSTQRSQRRQAYWTRKSAITYHHAASRMKSLGDSNMTVSVGPLLDAPKERALEPVKIIDRETDLDWVFQLACIKEEMLAGKTLEDTGRPGLVYSAHVQSWYEDFTASESVSRNWRTVRDRLAKELPSTRQRKDRDQVLVTKAWRQTLCYAVSHHPEKILTFLERTYLIDASLRIMFYHAFDCFILWSEKHLPGDSAQWTRISDFIAKSSSRGSRARVSGKSYATILRNLPVTDIPQCIDGWQKSGVTISGNTVLKAADLLAKNGHAEQAMKILNQHIDVVTQTATAKALQSVLASVLRAGSNLDDGLHVCQHIVTRMVERGVQLNLQLCNIIMLNAVDANDINTVFNVYEMVRRNGSTPDKYTFAILAKACKSPDAEEKQVARVIDDALRSGILLDEPVVAGEVLHALYQHHISKRRKDAFRLVMEAYGQLFDRDALEKLEISKVVTNPASSGPLQATPAVVGIVVEAYLKSAEPSPQEALALYRRIVHLADEKIQPFAEILKTDHVFTAFMAFFGANSATVPTAIEILRTRRAQYINSTQGDITADVASLFTRQEDFDGMSSAALGVLQVMFAKHSTRSNSFLGPAERILNHMLKVSEEIEPRNLMEMAHAYLRHGDADAAQRSIDQMVKMNVWDEAKGSGLRRMMANVRSDGAIGSR